MLLASFWVEHEATVANDHGHAGVLKPLDGRNERLLGVALESALLAHGEGEPCHHPLHRPVGERLRAGDVAQGRRVGVVNAKHTEHLRGLDHPAEAQMLE